MPEMLSAAIQEDEAGSSGSYVFPEVFPDLSQLEPCSGPDMLSLLDWNYPDSFDDFNMTCWPGTGWFPPTEPPNFHFGDLSPSGRSVSQPQPVEAIASPKDDPLHKHLRIPGGSRNPDEEEHYPMLWPATQPKHLTLLRLGPSKSSNSLSSYIGLPSIGSRGASILQDILKAPFEQSIWPAASIPSFPAPQQLDHCIDLYFAHFDKWLPIIHQPSFDPAKEPVLTLVLIMIGACYTDFEGASAFSIALSEFIRRLLVFMAEHDPRFVRTEYYISAQLLNSIFGFASGSQRLYELAESSRGALVNHARCMGLFDPHHAPQKGNDHSDTQSRWESWICAERASRIGWAVFTYDASSAGMRNARPYILLNELKLDLPCLTQHWKAASKQAWAAIHPWREQCPRTDSFQSCISRVVEHPASAHSAYDDNYVRFIILTVLTRMVWDNKEATTHQAAMHLSTYDALLKGRAELLQILDDFASPTTGYYPSATTEPSNEFTVQHWLQVGIAHGLAEGVVICDLFGIMLWQDESRAIPARNRILRWCRENPRNPRALLYTCAQGLTITRLYPCNHPQEAYNIFHCGLICFVVSTLLLADYQTMSNRETPGGTLPVCKLDWQGAPDGPEVLAIRDWIENGTPSRVRMHGVPEVFSVPGPRQILQQTADVLSNVSVWGIKHILLNAVRGLLHG
ncbi:Fungal specific transcription factor domain-containing protein [Cladophialophora immunda]|nr:Fungal specific transcription factor domain-containing protein [Cladophialophora immunda]